MADVPLSSMVARVRQYMMSFSQAQQQLTFLTDAVLSTDTVIGVDDATQVSRGLVELGGQELATVYTYDQGANQFTVMPLGGRGSQGSTAAAWPQNTQVENNPIFPYVRMVEAINDSIRSVYPDLFAVGQATLSKVSVQYGYALPADCEEILSVGYATVGPSLIDPWARRWRYNNNADTSRFPSGKSIAVLEQITPGRNIVVNYMKEPTELVNGADMFSAVTGLPSSAQDVVLYLACQKLSPTLDVARLLLDSAETSERASFAQAGSASKVSQYFGQLAAQRLGEEVRKLADRYPRPVHFDS